MERRRASQTDVTPCRWHGTSCLYHLLRRFSQGGDDGSDQLCSAQMKVAFRIIERQTGYGLPLDLSDEGVGGLFNRRGSHKAITPLTFHRSYAEKNRCDR